MSASEYKKRIKRHLYAKNYGGVIEESANHWNADIIGVNFKGEINEFEIKVSLSDLSGEVKAIKRALQGDIYKSEANQTNLWIYNRIAVEEKVSKTKLEKHYCYLVADKQKSMQFTGPDGHILDSRNDKECFIPSKFYFAVPIELVEKAKELLNGVPHYGIMDADSGEIKKPAKRLPRSNVRGKDYLNMFFRACTEWRDSMNRVDYLEEITEKGHRIYVKRKHVWTDFRGGEHVDWY